MITNKQFLNIAAEVSKSSKCVSLQVGAIIVKDNRIISAGYNGTAAGYYNCSDIFDGRCVEHSIWSNDYEIHAEMNAILHVAANSNESIKGSIMYCTHEPCKNCLKHMIGAQMSGCYFRKLYYRETQSDKNMKAEFATVSNFIFEHHL